MNRACPRLLLTLAVLALLTIPALGPGSARAETPPPAPSGWKLEPVATHDLPEELLYAGDIRASSHSEILVPVTFTGVLRWNFSEPGPPKLVVNRGNGARELWLAKSVAASGERFVASSFLFSYGWGRLDSDSQVLEELHAIELVADLDIHGERMLLIGAQRGEDRAFAPNGDIAWFGDLGQLPERMKPVLYSKDGPGIKSMDGCALMAMSSARFLADGSFVLVPGVEEGVFHFDATGQLLHTWTSETFGFDAGCPLEKEEVYRLSGDERGRWRWVNGRRVVDDRVYFLLRTYGLPPEGPDQPPRLVVMKITGKE